MNEDFHFGRKDTAVKYPGCCGKPDGCNRIDEGCAFRNHAWKRAVVKDHPKFDGGEALQKAREASPYQFCYECHGVHHIAGPHIKGARCREVCVCSMNGCASMSFREHIDDLEGARAERAAIHTSTLAEKDAEIARLKSENA